MSTKLMPTQLVRCYVWSESRMFAAHQTMVSIKFVARIIAVHHTHTSAKTTRKRICHSTNHTVTSYYPVFTLIMSFCCTGLRGYLPVVSSSVVSMYLLFDTCLLGPYSYLKCASQPGRPQPWSGSVKSARQNTVWTLWMIRILPCLWNKWHKSERMGGKNTGKNWMNAWMKHWRHGWMRETKWNKKGNKEWTNHE